MTDITVLEAMKKKLKLEVTIRDLCREFVDETELKISCINVVGATTYSKKFELVGINIDVELL